MSFEPASPLSIITCTHCQGKGCPQCDQLGIYGLVDDQPVAFSLPDFIDLQSRKRFKQLFLIKRFILIILSLFLILLIFTIANRYA